jgi:hypothetical protein
VTGRSPLRSTTRELAPVSAGRHAEEARVRRRFQGARVSSAAARLEPRDAGAILDLALEGLLARLGPALAVALFLWVPFRQMAELFGLSELDPFAANLYALLWNALSLVPIGVTSSVVVSLVADALVERRAPVAAGIRRGLARAPGTVVLLVVTQLATLPLMFLCVVPYFLAQWLTWAAVPIWVLEGEALLTPAERARARRSLLAYLAALPRRLSRAVRRSVRLSLGAPALGRWLLLAVLGQVLLGGVLELAATGLTHPEAREYLGRELGFGGSAAALVLGGVAAIFTALSSCLRAALMAGFYLDLRVRREGLDLERTLASAAEEPAPGLTQPSGSV